MVLKEPFSQPSFRVYGFRAGFRADWLPADRNSAAGFKGLRFQDLGCSGKVRNVGALRLRSRTLYGRLFSQGCAEEPPQPFSSSSAEVP